MKLQGLIMLFLLVCINTSAQNKILSSLVNDTSIKNWEYSLWGSYMSKPNDNNYLSGTFYADHKSLRIEGRYNYEAMNTASVFTGLNLSTGTSFKIDAIPMMGIVMGNTKGIAPALEAQCRYKKMVFYMEGEYLFDFSGKQNNYLFIYSELAYSLSKPFKLGVAALRTKLYQTAFDVQRGFFCEYYFSNFRTGVYYYDPFTKSNFAELSFSVDF